jgi:hypothetical protein
MITHELALNRKFLGKEYTIGKFFVEDKPFCDCLEDIVRDLNKDGDITDPGEGKIPKETAIPYGRYKVVMAYMGKLKRNLPLLLNVPSFTGIFIHGGVDKNSTEGCLVLGINDVKGQVHGGKKYVDELSALITKWEEAGDETYITIF